MLMSWVEDRYIVEVLMITLFYRKTRVFYAINNNIGVMWLQWCHGWHCVCNDVTSAKFLIKKES